MRRMVVETEGKTILERVVFASMIGAKLDQEALMAPFCTNFAIL